MMPWVYLKASALNYFNFTAVMDHKTKFKAKKHAAVAEYTFTTDSESKSESESSESGETTTEVDGELWLKTFLKNNWKENES